MRLRLFESVSLGQWTCSNGTILQNMFYPLQANAFERDDVPLPRVASFFQQEALKQQHEAEAMLAYLAERGATYCSKDIQVKCVRQWFIPLSFYFYDDTLSSSNPLHYT